VPKEHWYAAPAAKAGTDEPSPSIVREEMKNAIGSRLDGAM
jgi:hypothetical protein